MRRLVLAAACAAAAAAAPAQAAPPDLSKYVTVEFQPFVVCVTDPCPQPTPVVVCVVPAEFCTPK
jgi:hypothetical protein